jgi:hypothetical protein
MKNIRLSVGVQGEKCERFGRATSKAEFLARMGRPILTTGDAESTEEKQD